MADAPRIIDRLLEAPGIRALRCVHEAVAHVSDVASLAPFAAAGGGCPRFCFAPTPISEPALAPFPLGADVLADVAHLAGALAIWCTDANAVAEHIAAGGSAVVLSSRGWEALWSGSSIPELTPIPLRDMNGAVALLIKQGSVRSADPAGRPDQIVSRIAQACLDRTQQGNGQVVACGPVAVDAFRRALSKAAQEGLEQVPHARAWLGWLPLELAGQMFLAAEALRHVATAVGEDRRLRTALLAAASNFDAAAAFTTGVMMVAEAAIGWPQRNQSADHGELDAGHWGIVYEMLRQASYHWRSAAGWLTRELVRLQNFVAGQGD